MKFQKLIFLVLFMNFIFGNSITNLRTEKTPELVKSFGDL